MRAHTLAVFELAHDDVHLAMMEKVLGPIPADLLRRGFANINQYNRSLLLRDAVSALPHARHAL